MTDQIANSPNLINLSEAARMLGYQSTGPIKKLINEDKLHAYKLPDTIRVMVDRIELESLLEIYVPEQNNTDNN